MTQLPQQLNYKPKRNWWKIVTIILIVLAIGYGLFVLWQTQSQAVYNDC